MAMLFKKHDLVKVVSGKSSGKTGKIIRVLKSEGRVVVEGLNLAKKHQRPSQKEQKGGIVDKPLPIHASNLMLVDAKTSQPVKIARRIVDGKRIRVERKTGKAVE